MFYSPFPLIGSTYNKLWESHPGSAGLLEPMLKTNKEKSDESFISGKPHCKYK
jgi:hypothetical protein